MARTAALLFVAAILGTGDLTLAFGNGLQQGSADSAAARARGPRFEPLASFSGGFLSDPWSPIGDKLAFPQDGVLVFDAATPETPPVTVYRRWPIESVKWSPDGEWLICRTSGHDGIASLVIVPASKTDSTDARTVVWQAEITDFTWENNNHIYYWDRDGVRHELPPKVVLRAELAPSLPRLVGALDPQTRRAQLCRFVSSPAVQQVVLTALSSPSINFVIVRSSLRDGQGFLVTIVDDNGERTEIVDLEGRTVFSFAGIGFWPTSISPDGAWLIGDRTVEDGHNVLASTIHMARSDGTGAVQVANTGSGMQPFFSSTGRCVAFVDLEGTTHVGTIENGKFGRGAR